MKTISVADYKNKTYGAWAGKCAGGIIGAKQENNKNLLTYDFNNVFPDTLVPNDDFDLQILFLQEVLEKKGFNFDERDLADAFCLHNKCWANEYRVAIKNIDAGIYPPESGFFCNHYFKNSNGCPIRSELWAIVAPGNPDLACRFVEMDGYIDHATESVEVEKFFTAMESNAFFEGDIDKLIDASSVYLSKKSDAYRCLEYVRKECALNKDWRLTRNRLVREFGSADASYSVVNMGIVIIALLYGKKNFNDTMLIAVNCGYDTDCTSATAGAILGLIIGKEGIPVEWLEKIGEEFVIGTVDIVRERNTLTALTDDVFHFAYSLERDALTPVKFTGIDEDYVCPVPVYEPFINVETVYPDGPGIRPGVEKQVKFVIKNQADRDYELSGISFIGEYLKFEFDRQTLKIPPLGVGEINARVSTMGENGAVPESVKAQITFEGDRNKRINVGFMGESEYRLYGPFFDTYDTEKYDCDINEQLMPKDVFSMFNNFANIDREYLVDSEELNGDYKVFYSADDKLPVEENVGYKGTCCVYVQRRFVCDERKSIHMIFGYSEPCKAFLNGKEIFVNRDNVCWMPLNFAVEANLKKGENVLIYKLIRKNGKFEFSNILSQKEFGNGVLVSLKNIYRS